METKHKSRSSAAADYIRQNIINGNYKPGERIIEADIAASLSISRGPIREALKMLAKDGLLEYEENKGCSVFLPSAKEVWEIFFMRGHLEKMALEVYGAKIPPLNQLAMQHALEEMKAAQTKGEVEEIVKWDSAFHGEIVKASSITRLHSMRDSLSPLNLTMFCTGAQVGVFDFHDQWEKHEALFDVLKQGDERASCEAVMHHYLLTGERIIRNAL